MASFYLRTFPPEGQWLFRVFVRFTVTGIARKSHPYSHDAPDQRSAAPHGADPSADSFVGLIIPARPGQVKLKRKKRGVAGQNVPEKDEKGDKQDKKRDLPFQHRSLIIRKNRKTGPSAFPKEKRV